MCHPLGVDCCHILIQRFHHLRTREWPRNYCIDRSIIHIVHNMVPNNVEKLKGVYINNNGLKTLPWGTTEITLTDALTLT